MIFFTRIVDFNSCDQKGVHGTACAWMKRGKFCTIDSNVGGWDRVVPNFYKSQFFMAYLTPFLWVGFCLGGWVG